MVSFRNPDPKLSCVSCDVELGRHFLRSRFGVMLRAFASQRPVSDRVLLRRRRCGRRTVQRLPLRNLYAADPSSADSPWGNAPEGVLEPLGVSQADAATRMSIPFQRLNGIVKGRRAVSADTALLLDALTGWDAQIWLTLQAKWDLWHARKARGRRPKVRPLRKTA